MSLLRRIARALLLETFGRTPFDLSIQIVGEPEIVRLNETFLRHAGPTDVIAFDYQDRSGDERIHGELFVCLPVAIRQARRFRANWQSEVVRYVVHGVLHLAGYDDAEPNARRQMKKAEDKAMKRLSDQFQLRDLDARRPPARADLRRAVQKP